MSGSVTTFVVCRKEEAEDERLGPERRACHAEEERLGMCRLRVLLDHALVLAI